MNPEASAEITLTWWATNEVWVVDYGDRTVYAHRSLAVARSVVRWLREDPVETLAKLTKHTKWKEPTDGG